MEMTYVWLILASLAGGFLQSAIGFGYATVVMVFFPMFLPSIPVASTVCAVLAFLASCIIFFQYRKAARPKHVLWPILIYLVVMPFAVGWSTRVPKLILSVILGLFLLLLGLYYLFTADRIRVSSTPGTGMAVGLLSGVFGGLFAVSAPPAALYCLSTLDTKEAYIGTLQFFFLITNTYAVGVRAVNGLVTSQVLIWSLIAVGGLLLGLWLGQAVFYKRADLSLIKRWVFIFIACMGAWTIVSSLGIRTQPSLSANKPSNTEEIRAFSYAEETDAHQEHDPGVKYEGFQNMSELQTGSRQEAVERARAECTVEWDTVDVFYDDTADMWMVVFHTAGTLGGGQTVYLDGSGRTHLIVYGE